MNNSTKYASTNAVKFAAPIVMIKLVRSRKTINGATTIASFRYCREKRVWEHATKHKEGTSTDVMHVLLAEDAKHFDESQEGVLVELEHI